MATSSLIASFRGLSLTPSGDCSSSYRMHSSLTLPRRNKVSTFPLTIEMAHKKGAGSTKNGRDSIGKRLGVKIFGDQLAKPGSIIIRQRGTKWYPGNNVGMGKDYTLFSLIDGLVKFEKFGPEHRQKVSVYPREVQPENPNSYRARKREAFRLQREKKKARREGYVFEPQLVLASAEAETEDTDATPAC